MKVGFVWAVALSFLVGTNVPAHAETDRTYPAELENSSLPEEAISIIKSFDALAFKDNQQVFVGLSRPRLLRQAEQGKQAGVHFINVVRYQYQIPEEARSSELLELFWSMSGVGNFGAKILRVEGNLEPELLVVGVGAVNEHELRLQSPLLQAFDQAISLETILDESEYVSDNSCALYRQVNGTTIGKTIIFVRVGRATATNEKELLSAYDCVYRGLLYHTGHSNVLEYPIGQFAMWHNGRLGRVLLPRPTYLTSLPPSKLFVGGFNGLSRSEVLIRYVQHLESLYEGQANRH